MKNKKESTEDCVTNGSEVISYMHASDTVNIIKLRDSSSGYTNQYHHYISEVIIKNQKDCVTNRSEVKPIYVCLRYCEHHLNSETLVLAIQISIIITYSS